MDDSIVSDLPTSQGSSQEGTAASTSRNPNTRFAGATSTSKNQFNTRDLFDETLDLGAAGTTDIPDEDSRLMQIPRQHGTSLNGEYATNRTRLPLDEMERMNLHDKAQGSATAASGGTASSTSNVHHQATYQPESGLGRKDQENAEDDLPTVPPLSAEERRTQALTRERDDLAKMNTLLEAAIASITRAVPKMEVSFYYLHSSEE